MSQLAGGGGEGEEPNLMQIIFGGRRVWARRQIIDGEKASFLIMYSILSGPDPLNGKNSVYSMICNPLPFFWQRSSTLRKEVPYYFLPNSKILFFTF
jgi:hypothetical protein